MRATLAPLLFAALVAANPAPVPQAVTAAIAPAGSPPPGCSENYQGSFLIGPVNVTKSKRSLEIREIDERNTQLGITLVNGILTDPQGRTGYIAANEQFQFDGPPQAGAIYTAGFSVCPNGTLALGSDVTWWKCLSGDFFNLYFESIGGQCIESYLIARPQGGSGGPLPPSVSPSGTVTIQTIQPNATASSTGNESSSGISSSGAANATASSSGAAGASGSTTVITKSSTTITSIIGGGTVGGHHTTATGGGNTNTRGGQQTTTTGGGGGTATGAQSAASSSSSPGAAPMATMKAEVFGLAAGVLALAVL